MRLACGGAKHVVAVAAPDIEDLAAAQFSQRRCNPIPFQIRTPLGIDLVVEQFERAFAPRLQTVNRLFQKCELFVCQIVATTDGDVVAGKVDMKGAGNVVFGGQRRQRAGLLLEIRQFQFLISLNTYLLDFCQVNVW